MLTRKRIIGLTLMAYDALTIGMSGIMALLIRFDFLFSNIEEQYLLTYRRFIILYIIGCLFIYYVFKCYSFLWRFASLYEFVRVCGSVCATCVLKILLSLLYGYMPISYYILSFILELGFSLVIRFAYRFYLMLRGSSSTIKKNNVMVIGAGSAGQMITRDINKNKEEDDRVVCIIDDNPNKWRRWFENVEVVGGRDSIEKNVEKYDIDKIVIAIPSASKLEISKIVEICARVHKEVKIIPSIVRFVDEDLTIKSLRKVEINDLLGREPVKVDMKEVYEDIIGKRVLVTGGGGSIGSELCRQVAKHSPKELIIFDIYENNAYEIQQELKREYPYLNLVVLIGSVRDEDKVMDVFEKYRPDIVYHAAAHKHVPLMEDSPCEAIKNNVKGTYNVAFACMKYNVSRMVLISTDKAVNPTNIMGASKRLCEMSIQAFAENIKKGKQEKLCEFYGKKISLPKKINTIYTAVRFGNVLGSNGSVIPLFKKQIKIGGPVTVTSPDIVRYFMSIPEAVSLVMEAGVYAKGGEIFVLDMGEPVKIDDLARNLIRLSGYVPDEDIKIVYTGLRPGEKMYEERLMAEEGLEKTQNDAISIGKPLQFNASDFPSKLARLVQSADENKKDIEKLVKKMVPTYVAEN